MNYGTFKIKGFTIIVKLTSLSMLIKQQEIAAYRRTEVMTSTTYIFCPKVQSVEGRVTGRRSSWKRLFFSFFVQTDTAVMTEIRD